MNDSPVFGFLSWLLTASLHATLAALVIVVIQRALPQRFPAWWRFALWLPFVLILLLPALPQNPVRAGPFWRVAPAETPGIDFGGVVAGEGSSGDPIKAGLPVAGGTGSLAGMNLHQVAGWMWLGGFAGVTGMGLVAYLRQLRWIRQSAEAVPLELLEEVGKACKLTGLQRVPEVVCSPAVRSPAVTGPWRPVLLLPVGFWEQTPVREAGLILQHEMLHLKHRDTAWDVLFWMLNAAHWFNPVIWFAFVRLRADREAARDAGVLAEAGVEDRAAYGAALLRLQLPPRTALFQAGFAGLMNGGAGMKRRLAGLAHHRRIPRGWHAAGVGLVILIQLTAGVSAQTKPPAVSPPVAAAETAIVTKAKSLKIERMMFEGASIQEVMDYVRMKSIEVDKAEQNRDKKGVDLILHQSPKSRAPWVTLDLKNTTVFAVLEEAARQVGFKVGPNAEGTALVVGAPEAIAVPPPAGQPAAETAVSRLASSLILGRVQFRDATVKQVAAYMERQSQRLDPAGQGVKIQVDPAVGEGKRVTLELRDISLVNLAKSVADMAGVALVDDGTALVFRPAPTRK